MIRRIRLQLTLGALLAIAPLTTLAADADIRGFEFGCRFSDGTVLKPKFGDIEGVFYTDLPAQREQCLDAIKRKIVLCEQNIDFASNSENNEYPNCLPEFRKQAEVCIGHFQFERGKCHAGGAQQADQAEQKEEPDYVVDAVEREMEVIKRANVRGGPGTDYEVIATLEGGIGVRVTGEVQGFNWVRVDVLEGGGDAFIYAPLLKRRESAIEASMVSFGPKWTIVENQLCQTWNRGKPEVFQGVTWTGDCVDGKTSGYGKLKTKTAGGLVEEGEHRDGQSHGSITTWLNGEVWATCEFRYGEFVYGSCK